MSTIFNGKEILILGAGTSGSAAALFLNDRNISVTVLDEKNISEEIKNKFIKNRINYKDNTVFDNFDNFDYIIKSPGIPWSKELKELFIQKRNVIDEIELASYFINVPIIAVTGTNGKSTVVSLITHVLRVAGFTAFMGGNIGIPLTEAVNKPLDVVVLEMSSYQIETINNFKADISLILNISPDHLNRYKDFDEYVETKLKLMDFTKDTGVIWLNNDDKYLKEFIDKNKTEKIWRFSSREPVVKGVYYSNDILYYYEGNESNYIEYNLEGISFNTFKDNIVAAIGVLLSWGINIDTIKYAIESFKPLSHRLESFYNFNNIIFVDDSKSTNPDSLSKAITVFNPNETLFLVGGEAKSEGYEQLKDDFQDIKVIFFGRDGEKLSKLLEKESITFPTLDKLIDNLKDILIADSNIKNVVLSPGCASFDEFKNFNERGNFFKNKIMEVFYV